jgi:hypothetical protein
MAELKDVYNYSPRIIDPAMLDAASNGRVGDVVSNPAEGIYTFPLYTPDYCSRFIEVCEATGRFDVSDGATYAVPELRLTIISKLVMEAYLAVIGRFILPVIEEIWEVGDHFDLFRVPFICRYNMETVQHMNRHHDAHAVISLSVNLNNEYEGGGLYFHRQDFNCRDIPIGHCIMFPSMLTHEHEALPITAGVRYGLTCWLSSTKADTRADEGWVVRPSGE